MSVSITGLVKSISAYIDQYSDIELSKEQNQVIIKARKVIVEALEYVKINHELSSPGTQKIKKKLDDSFKDVINIFSNTGLKNPEIQESIKSKKVKDTPMGKKEPKLSKKLRKIQKKKKKPSPDIAPKFGEMGSMDPKEILKQLFNPTDKEAREMKAKLAEHGLPPLGPDQLFGGLSLPKGIDTSLIMMPFLQLMAKRMDKIIEENKRLTDVNLMTLDIIKTLDKKVDKLEKKVKSKSKK